MPASQGHTLYDVVNKEDVLIRNGEVESWCQEHQTYRELLSRLKRNLVRAINGRYILPQNKNKIFTLIDYESKQEFECITSLTMCYYLGIPLEHSTQVTHDISKLFKKRQKCNYVQIQGRLLCLKGNTTHPRISKHIHNYKRHITERQDRNLRRKIASRLRHRLSHAIKTQGALKSEHTEQLLGCSFENFLLYLQAKFQSNMSWNNYGRGGWEIDHIQPCAKFNLLDPSQQKLCFHYTNLQPLWARENRIKQDN